MNVCQCCGEPLGGHTQSGFGFGPDRREEHCLNPECDLYLITWKPASTPG